KKKIRFGVFYPARLWGTYGGKERHFDMQEEKGTLLKDRAVWDMQEDVDPLVVSPSRLK
ncbi:hypothetical protein scyTo_0027294, partial [Scyliorhinus torazame]|nr:hypothetical protein [Scyliorhinus torazame]